MVTLAEARGPEGMRLYAIGDTHGCLETLEALYDLIQRDLADRPIERWRMVLLGDYVDRGPDSRGVLDWVAARLAEGRTTAVLGNHDAMFLEAMEMDDGPTLELWLRIGGQQTVASFGVTEIPDGPGTLRRHLLAEVPERYRSLLRGLPLTHLAGDYLLVHAGIDPERALDDQRREDLIWIRRPFLDSDSEHPVVVVHGHTPTDEIEIRPNRIGLDTGAVFGGRLSCLVIDGDKRRYMAVDGPGPWQG